MQIGRMPELSLLKILKFFHRLYFLATNLQSLLHIFQFACFVYNKYGNI